MEPQTDGAMDEAYFMILYACQRTFNLPQWAHSFASFTQVIRDRQELRVNPEQSFSISWLPQSQRINIWGDPEAGTNLDLDPTFAWAAGLECAVSAVGPFRIKPELHARARERWSFLEAHGPQFVVLDDDYRPEKATNCIHAISDLGLTKELLDTGMAYGKRATRKLAEYLQPWIMSPQQTHPWLIDLLGLKKHPVEIEAPSATAPKA